MFRIYFVRGRGQGRRRCRQVRREEKSEAGGEGVWFVGYKVGVTRGEGGCGRVCTGSGRVFRVGVNYFLLGGGRTKTID